MSGRAKSRGRWLIAAAMCLLAIVAVLITVPTVLAGRSAGTDAGQLAPGLAALTDQHLAGLLPKQNDFPASWTVKDTAEVSDTFGYFKYHVHDDGLGFSPAECFPVIGVASTGAFHVAEVSGHDPADAADVSDREDIRLTVGREFDTAGFDALINLVSRCSRFTSAAVGGYAVQVLEDTRPDAGPQRFRYSLTTTMSGEPAEVSRTDYYSYARVRDLILSGSASTGHQQAFDALFDNTLRRFAAH
jgi:hypothetical protein